MLLICDDFPLFRLQQFDFSRCRIARLPRLDKGRDLAIVRQVHNVTSSSAYRCLQYSTTTLLRITTSAVPGRHLSLSVQEMPVGASRDGDGCMYILTSSSGLGLVQFEEATIFPCTSLFSILSHTGQSIIKRIFSHGFDDLFKHWPGVVIPSRRHRSTNGLNLAGSWS